VNASIAKSRVMLSLQSFGLKRQMVENTMKRDTLSLATGFLFYKNHIMLPAKT